MIGQCGPSDSGFDWRALVQLLSQLISTLFTAWLVHRRYLADKREAKRNGATIGKPDSDL